MKRYLKATIFTFAILILTFLAAQQVINSPWGQKQFLSSLTELITANTPIKAPKLSYQQITWGGVRHPLSLSVHEVEICDDSEGKFSVERLYVSWSLPEICRAHFIPSWFSIKKGHLRYQNQPILTADLTIQSHTTHQTIMVEHLSLIPGKLSSLKFCPTPIKAYLTAVDLPVEAFGQLSFTQKELTHLHLTLNTKEGNFTLPPYFPIPIPLSNLQLEVSSTSPQHIKATLAALTNQTQLSTKAQITLPESLADLWQQGGKIELSISGNVTDIAVNALPTLWPVGLAVKPRHWVTTNLSHGNINGTIDTKMTIIVAPEAEFSGITVHSLSGDLYPKGVTVSYLGNLPKVEQTSGHCHYTKQQFIIDNITGVVNELQLRHGHILIDDLHKKDQSIQITLDLIGNVARAFEIISAEPLCLLQKLGLLLDQPDGLSTTQVFLKFPLETGVSIDHVHVEAKSHITDAKAGLNDIIANYPLHFTQGDFNLEVDRNHLHMSGSTQVDDAPTTLEWTEYFKGTKSNFTRKLELQAIKPLMVGSSDSPLIQGKIPLQLRYEKDKNDYTSLHLKALLDEVMLSLPWFSYHKSLTDPGTFELELHSTPGNGISIPRGHLKGKDLNVNLSGFWGGKAPKLTFSNLQIGEMLGSLSLSKENQRLKLNGRLNEFDAFTLLNKLPISEGKLSSFPSLHGDIRLRFDKLIFSNDYAVNNAAFTLQLTAGNIETIYLKDKADELNFALAPCEEGVQTFNLESTNAAELLELFAPGNDLTGGKINFVGTIKKVESEFCLNGEIDIKNLTVHEAPTLAKILSLSSVEGILRTLSGEELKFDHGHAYMSWKAGEVLIHNAHLIGTALGLTFAGTVSGDNVSFTGEVIPFYSINSILSRIPVVGQLLSGNSDHAIFSTPFILSGSWKNPDIQVQPLATLAPGGMRKIFHQTTGDKHSPQPIKPYD